MALDIIPVARGATGMTPDDLYKQAEEYLQTDRLDEAEDIFSWLLEHDMNNIYCLFGMANCMMKRKRNIAALHMFERIVQLKPDFGEGWNNLGYLYQNENLKERSQECFEKALELHPDQPAFHNNLGTVYVNAGKPEKALEHCEKAIAIDPNNVDAQWNRSLALLEMQRWEEGFQAYEWGLHDEGKRKKRTYERPDSGVVPQWDGTPGQNVVVYGEQGVGDEIMFASILPDLVRDCESVIYDAHPRLAPIMRHSMPEITVYGTRKQTDLFWPAYHKIDAHCPIGSLGKHYRSQGNFPRTPYLKPDEALVAEFKERLAELGPRPNIGISWKGGTKTTRNDLRSISLDQWEPIFNAIDANWISLQYSENAGSVLEVFQEESGRTLHHWQSDLDDLYRNYLGLMPALDLTISVCTSAVHAAGALGLPCWCLVPSQPAWRYGVSGDMSWYDIKLFRQEGDDWSPVVEQVASQLKEEFDVNK